MLVVAEVVLANHQVQALQVVLQAETELLNQAQHHLVEMAEQILAVAAAEEILDQFIIQVKRVTAALVLLL
jgi:hypothetical protein